MDDLITNSDTHLTMEDFSSLSPYDPAYPIALLSDEFEERLAEAEASARDIYQAVTKAAPVASQIGKAATKSSRYVVQMSKAQTKAIESGDMKLVTSEGRIFAQLRNADGKYGEHLPIKKEDLVSGINPVAMTMALQLKAMQEQLESISEQLSLIDHNVRDVLTGQQNDRIGQIYSAISLFIEAGKLDNTELRTALIAQSLRALSDAIFKLRLNLENDIRYLINGEYLHAKGKRVELIDERMTSINQGFAFIHQASLLKAGIYLKQGEVRAMASALDEYSRFIETDIAGNAYLLAQCDASDDGSYRSVWNQRASFRIDTGELVRQVSAGEDKVIYLKLEEETA